MPSKLGRLIRDKRTELGYGLRQFAGKIEKSPAFVVALETNDKVPPVLEATLRKVAKVLELDSDLLMSLAAKIPEDALPKNEVDIALYRRVRSLSKTDKERLIKKLSKPKDK